jgi:hypothetical protein
MASSDDCGGDDGGCDASGSGVSGVGSASPLDSPGSGDSVGRGSTCPRAAPGEPPSSTWLTLPTLPGSSPVEGGGIAPGTVNDRSLMRV